MEISLNWLKKYINLDASVEAISTALTSVGFEVEGMQSLGGEAQGVVSAEVLTCSKHPDADKLSLCTVTDGTETFPVVCGAPNVAAGQKVLLAKIGASLPSGLKIKKGKIRGEESFGMLCAEDELGLGDSHEGILVLPPETPLGISLQELPGLTDTRFELNVTPNRPDGLCHVGIARELAAHFQVPLQYPLFQLQEKGPAINSLVTVTVEDQEGCSNYTGRVIQGIKVGPSPTWLKAALKSLGKKSINNVVDLTNYVLLEFGQPSHAFDLKKIHDRQITIRRSRDQEKLTTLDGIERQLAISDLIIADGNGPVCLAGVMGGLGSGVDENTTDIFLEVAYFQPAGIRRQAKRHGLSSDSSYRFERGVDPLHTAWVSDYLAASIVAMAGGEVAQGQIRIQASQHPVTHHKITLRPERVAKVLGKTLDSDTIVRYLTGLELKLVSIDDAGAFTFEIPGYRVDLEVEVDLIEELARLHNFNQIPTTLPKVALSFKALPPIEKVSRAIRHWLEAQGLQETLHLRFSARKLLDQMLLPDNDLRRKFVPLRNPLSEEWEILPSTLWPSLFNSIGYNQNNQEKTCRFFEISKAFFQTDETRGERSSGVTEEDVLSIALTGEWKDCSWSSDAATVQFHHIKGLIENLLVALKLNAEIVPPSREAFLHPVESADIVLRKGSTFTKIGSLGVLHPQVKSNFDLKGSVVIAELSLSKILSAAFALPTFKPFGNFSASSRDINVLVDESISHGEILSKIPRQNIPLLREIKLNSIYRGQGVLEGKKALHYTLVFQHAEKTLTDEEVNTAKEKVSKALLADGRIVFK